MHHHIWDSQQLMLSIWWCKLNAPALERILLSSSVIPAIIFVAGSRCAAVASPLSTMHCYISVFLIVSSLLWYKEEVLNQHCWFASVLNTIVMQHSCSLTLMDRGWSHLYKAKTNATQCNLSDKQCSQWPKHVAQESSKRSASFTSHLHKQNRCHHYQNQIKFLGCIQVCQIRPSRLTLGRRMT